MVSTEPLLAQFISLFTTGKNRLSIVQNHTSIQVYHFKISFKKNKFVSTDKIFFVARCEKTCLTGPLECKYRVIHVLVLGVIVLYEEQLDDNTRYRYHMEDNDFKMLLSLEIKS